MTDVLSSSERKLFIVRQELAAKLLPVCEALKLAGFESATIADIMQNLQAEPKLPERFTIMNNRYLVYKPDAVYDLHLAQMLGSQPDEPKRMGLIFWL